MRERRRKYNFFFFWFFRLHLWHVEVPQPGFDQICAAVACGATATAMLDP